MLDAKRNRYPDRCGSCEILVPFIFSNIVEYPKINNQYYIVAKIWINALYGLVHSEPGHFVTLQYYLQIHKFQIIFRITSVIISVNINEYISLFQYFRN